MKIVFPKRPPPRRRIVADENEVRILEGGRAIASYPIGSDEAARLLHEQYSTAKASARGRRRAKARYARTKDERAALIARVRAIDASLPEHFHGRGAVSEILRQLELAGVTISRSTVERYRRKS